MTQIPRMAIVTRDVTPDEIVWLERTYKEGDVLWEFVGTTYGCIDWRRGAALSEHPGENPFFEFPYDAFEYKQPAQTEVE